MYDVMLCSQLTRLSHERYLSNLGTQGIGGGEGKEWEKKERIRWVGGGIVSRSSSRAHTYLISLFLSWK